MEALRKRYARELKDATRGVLTSESNPRGWAGPVPGYPIGSTFPNRAACSAARVHGKTVAGIHGTKRYGAYSICLSGGYIDDRDLGETIVYTGTGGLNSTSNFRPTGGGTGKPGNQSFDHPDNAALAMNVTNRRPVRVIRGPSAESRFAPACMYRYDGLYTVKSASYGKGEAGNVVCQFQLERVPGQEPLPSDP